MTNPPLQRIGDVDLPAHDGRGGFDHAAVHAASGHVYVAHTANDTVDVFDPATGRHLYSVLGLTGAAGVVVSDEAQLVFSTNRGEDTIGIFAPSPAPQVRKVAVGRYPNGAAFDHVRRRVLVANVGDPAMAGSHTLTVVDLDTLAVTAEIRVPGRTRWAVYDPVAEAFYVNIADPSQIVVVNARAPTGIARSIAVPAAGAHGLDLDTATGRLFCACDAGLLIVLDAASGKLLGEAPLSGPPDVVFFNRQRQQLYVAVGQPGVIDVFDTTSLAPLGTVPTERGAHTLAIAPGGDRVYALLPATHRAAIYQVS